MRSCATTHAHRSQAVAALPVTCALLWGCVSPVPELWPPPSDAPTLTVYVSLDTWHAMIAFPLSKEQAASSEQRDAQMFLSESSSPPSPQRTDMGSPLFEEWGYAERAWYVEARRGLSGILRALFWPTEGVVEVGQYEQVWADRTPQPPSELFVVHVSEEGFRRLRRHLRGTVSGDEPIASLSRSTFYPAVRSYHVFHTCHQYAASALQEAGLPISAVWAFNRTTLAWQLQRVARMAAEQSRRSSQETQ